MEESKAVTKFMGERLKKAGALKIHISVSNLEICFFVSKAQPELSRQRYVSNDIGVCFLRLEPTPAKGRFLISRSLAGGADDHDGEQGEADDEEEGEGDHRPPVSLPYLCP